VGELAAVVADTNDVPAEIVSAISVETDGNPFFVREVLLHLIEDGAPDRWASATVVDLEIPEGVRETIGRRLSRLSDDTNRLLAVAAAFEAAFRLDDVAALAGLGEDVALDAIDEALAAQMLRPGDGFDRYEFVHALIRHTLWAELNPSRQVRLHRAIADQIEKRTGHNPMPDEASLLARHFHHSAALPGAERGVGYALIAADEAGGRYAPTEELQAVTIALELLSTGDERYGPLHLRAARAAILAREWATALVHARIAVEQTALVSGPNPACELAVFLGRRADRVLVNAGWSFGQLADGYQAVLDPGGETMVQLLAWKVQEGEHFDPDNPGIAAESPGRQRMNDLAERLPARQRPSGPGGYRYPSAAKMLSDYNHGAELAWSLSFGGAGHYREAADRIRADVDNFRAVGYVSMAAWGLGMLGRILLVLGELDRAAEIQREGEQLLERLEPGSNPAGQFQAISIMRAQLVDLDLATALPDLERYVSNSDRADMRWGAAVNRMWCAFLRAAMGDHRRAVEELEANVGAIEHGFVGEGNYPILVHFAAQTLWLTARSEHADLFERNLHAKVLEPDFSYAESDGRWTAALLCALTGRHDDARGWFQQSYDRLTAQEAILLIPHVCCDEALMEIRRGPNRDRGNARRRLDEARRWVDRIGLPNLLPRIDDLEARLAN
jgi:hypothetical protein